ncbi:hypothetical protein VTI28DRAFT_387 [Corynascus sepedonium]
MTRMGARKGLSQRFGREGEERGGVLPLCCDMQAESHTSATAASPVSLTPLGWWFDTVGLFRARLKVQPRLIQTSTTRTSISGRHLCRFHKL